MFHRNPEYIHTLVTQSNPRVLLNTQKLIGFMVVNW